MAVTKVALAPHQYMGLSSDTKPTGVPAGSSFWEYDTGIKYETHDGSNWTSLVPLVGEHKHMAASGQVKGSAGVLLAVIINRADSTAGATITLYDSPSTGGTVIAILSMDEAVYVIPTTLAYNLAFANGLYAEFSDEVTADITVSYR